MSAEMTMLALLVLCIIILVSGIVFSIRLMKQGRRLVGIIVLTVTIILLSILIYILWGMLSDWVEALWGSPMTPTNIIS